MLARRILIADPDTESIRWLKRALRQKGHQVYSAADGSRALELVVLRQPDLTLFDEACPLIDAQTFLQIVRANPRTENLPVVLLTSDAESAHVRAFRDGFLQKPFNLDEVQSRIEQMLRKTAAARELHQEAREIEGQLSQMGLPDLLQVLALNKRSGRLLLAQGAERGEIQVEEGRPVGAKSGSVGGTKALFRLLVWTEGAFAFLPGAPTMEKDIHLSMDEALLEGHRQADERARLWEKLPSRNSRLRLAPGAKKTSVSPEVLACLDTPRTLSEVLDLVALPDVEILGALSALSHQGLLQALKSTEDSRGPLLDPGHIHALRARILKAREAQGRQAWKIWVVASQVNRLTDFRSELFGLWSEAPEPSSAETGFFTLGRLLFEGGLAVDCMGVWACAQAFPLWRAFVQGSLGALVLDDAPPSLAVAQYLVFERRQPLVFRAPAVPPSFQAAPGVVATFQDAQVMLRALFLQLLSAEETRSDGSHPVGEYRGPS